MTTSDYYVDGIDLCSIQCPGGKLPDFKAVFDAGFEFVYVKSSQYSRIQDHMFSKIVEAATRAGLNCGAYHFCSQSTTTSMGWEMTVPEEQMEFFYKASEGLGKNPSELPPMIDWEHCTKPSKAQCVDWLRKAAKKAEELWYPQNDSTVAFENGWKARKPVVYTYPYYAQSHQPDLSIAEELGEYPLCFASYKSKGQKLLPWYPLPGEAPLHKVPKPWDKALLVQYSGNNGLKVPGISVDCDRQVFTGTGEDWERFVGR